MNTIHNSSLGPAVLEKPLLSDLERAFESNYRVVLLNDSVNTFDHVENCLQEHIGMSAKKAHEIALRVHHDGSAVVYVGRKILADHYYGLLKEEGLTVKVEPDTP